MRNWIWINSDEDIEHIFVFIYWIAVTDLIRKCSSSFEWIIHRESFCVEVSKRVTMPRCNGRIRQFVQRWLIRKLTHFTAGSKSVEYNCREKRSNYMCVCVRQCAQCTANKQRKCYCCDHRACMICLNWRWMEWNYNLNLIFKYSKHTLCLQTDAQAHSTTDICMSGLAT